MKKSALALGILAMASIADVRSADDFSLLRCGVSFGDRTLTYNAEQETRSKFDARMNHVLDVARPEPVAYTPMQVNESANTASAKTETRLPAKFTLATIGCSWR